MDDQIYIDDEIIKNIDNNNVLIKNKINIVLKYLDNDKATTDINYIKTLIDKLIPHNISLEGKTILLLFILNEYSEYHHIEFMSIEVKGFFSTLCLTLLSDLNFDILYEHKVLIDSFNIILIKYLKNCNELETIRILESFLRFKKNKHEKVLNLFQLQVVRQLFNHGKYNEILNLINQFNIDDFDSIIDKELIRNDLLTYFHYISYTLIIFKSYQRAYNLIHITLNLNLFVEINEFHQLLSEFIFLSLMLNKDSNNTDVIIVKYKNKIFPRLLRIYQSYQMYDIESFISNYYLYINQLQNHKQKHLCQIFNYESLTVLCHQLIQNKLSIYKGKFTDDFMIEKVNSVNELISDINKQFIDQNFKLTEFKLDNNNNNDRMMNLDYISLLSDCQRLIDVSSTLKKFDN